MSNLTSAQEALSQKKDPNKKLERAYSEGGLAGSLIRRDKLHALEAFLALRAMGEIPQSQAFDMKVLRKQLLEELNDI